MRTFCLLLSIAAAFAGCTLPDTNPNWNPQAEYPAWAYDAPFYYRPSDDLQPAETIGGIPVYYTAGLEFFVKHPGNYQLTGSPRMAVFLSPNAGETYSRIGYFGVEQTHFLAQVETDGVYWIRFVGPNRDLPDSPPPQPHRVYVADSTPPQISVTIIPGPWENEEKRIPHLYAVGDEVLVRWSIDEPNLVPDSIMLGSCFSHFPDNILWSQIPAPLPASGSARVRIPDQAATRGGLRFRISAMDKAGNLGVGFSEILRVVGAPAADDPLPNSLDTDPMLPPPAAVTGGWPMPGSFLRGGTSMVLTDLPQNTADYPRVALQFSADNGRSWRTLTTEITPGRPVRWTVPQVTSRMCRIRLLAAHPNRPEVVIRESRPFTVHTWAGPVIDEVQLPVGPLSH